MNSMNQINIMSCTGKKISSGRPVAPDSSNIDVCHDFIMSAAVVNKLVKQPHSLDQIQ